MDEEERKKYGLPADYVTIAMLRERWLKKQEEQKLKEKREQELLDKTQNLEKDCENQPHGELEVRHRFENNGRRKGVGKDGGEMAFIEDKGKGKGKGKGKEKVGWAGNGRKTSEKYYQCKNKNNGADWKKRNGDIDTEKRQNPRPKEWLDLVEKKNGSEGVEIILKNKEKVGNTGLPSGESSVRRDGFSGGFRRNKNDWDEGVTGKDNGIKLKELKDDNSLGKKMEDEVLKVEGKGNGRNWWQRRRNRNKVKQNGAEMSGLKLNAVELKSKDEIPETGNERDHMKGLHSGTGRNGAKQNSVNGEVMTADTSVLRNKMEDTVLAEKNMNDESTRYGNRRGNLREKIENPTFDGRKGPYLGTNVERKFGGNVNSGRLVVLRKMKQRNCRMVWVKKERSGAVGGEASSAGVWRNES
ncbi:uncharacterized protein [Henckelia pumila]|uniref:uncharacterized protein n=1 Tax=Henckelia pumila TaxID=405737 RepID=UPI003C6E75DF